MITASFQQQDTNYYALCGMSLMSNFMHNFVLQFWWTKIFTSYHEQCFGVPIWLPRLLFHKNLGPFGSL